MPALGQKHWKDLWLPGNGDETIVLSDSTLTRGSGQANFLSLASNNVPHDKALWDQSPNKWVRGGAKLVGFHKYLVEMLDHFAEWGHCAKYGAKGARTNSEIPNLEQESRHRTMPE